MTFSLDTNAVIAVLNAPRGSVGMRLRTVAPADVVTSAVVMHELYFGAYRSARVEANLVRVDKLRFHVIEFTREDAARAGEVRAALAAAGMTIGAYDAMIAGQALARGLTVVTANTREFARVPGLSVEDWSVEG